MEPIDMEIQNLSPARSDFAFLIYFSIKLKKILNSFIEYSAEQF